MAESIEQLKEGICEIGRRIWQRGFCAGNEGNHSVRLDEGRVLCTPTGISKGFMEPDDLCLVDLEGNLLEPNARGRGRTSEVLVHLAIYKKRPDIKAVIHSHPPHAVAFCLAGIPLPEGVHPEAEVFLGRTVFSPYATPGKPDLADSFIDRITEHTNTILMANHGTVSFSHDLFDAYYNLEILDNYCRQLLLAMQLGRINTLSTEQMADLLNVKQNFGFTDERADEAGRGQLGGTGQPFFTLFKFPSND